MPDSPGAGITRPAASVRFTFEQRPVTATPGLSVAAALIEQGILGFRDTELGERGVFCGMGVCGECTVQIDGVPNQLACMTEIAAGMRVSRQPARARMSLSGGPPALPEAELAPGCLVVGGGPAGLAAAATAAAAGVDTVLVDERPKLGGQYYKQPAAGFALEERRLDAQYRAGRALIAGATRSGARILTGVRIWGAAGAHQLYGAGPSQRWVLRPRRLVIATGAYERAVPFPGWTLPGVMTTGAAQTLLRSHQVVPGRRVLIAGNGPLNVQLAAELVRAGAGVVALVELADMFAADAAPHMLRMALASPRLACKGLSYLAAIRAARIPIITGATVVRACGSDRVRAAVVAKIAADGTADPASERSYELDAVCLGMGFMPGGELARLLGAEHHVDPTSGGYVVDSSATGRTSVANVWVIGDGASVRGANVAQSIGALAGFDVARSLGREPGRHHMHEVARRRHERFQRALWRVYRAPRLFGQLASDETVICRCESVTRAELEGSLGEVASAGALKRLTRVGMGRCQGRFCGFVTAEQVAGRTGAPVDHRAGFAPQLPIRPAPAGVLAAPGAVLAGAGPPAPAGDQQPKRVG